MKLNVVVKAGSRKEGIEKTDESNWIIKVRAPALEGRANDGIIILIAQELGIPKSRVSIYRGEKSKHKVIEIAD